MKLHNICIDKNMAVPLSRYHEFMREGNEWRVYDKPTIMMKKITGKELLVTVIIASLHLWKTVESYILFMHQ
jgi:hypothetical protein